MLPRLSVKKPYTIMVAVVLVLILGFVSFSKMNTDLLPSMNLPYAIVMTTYPGASPETVETIVTRPIEQSMATVSDIENVSSQSRENVSVVILEFQETTNMDSVTIEIREKLDQISGYWDDMVGKPMIMKLNPDMLPIMIAAVEIDGLEATEVTDYVKNHIEAEVESVAGVASVSTTGNITESVNVTIREDLVRATNKKIMAAIDKTFKEKEDELNEAKQEFEDGKTELENGKQELEDGKTALNDGKTQFATGIAAGKQQLTSAQTQITQGSAELNAAEEEVRQREEQVGLALQAIDFARTQANQAKAPLVEAQTTITNLQSAIAGLESTEYELQTSASSIQAAIATVDAQIGALEGGGDFVDSSEDVYLLYQQRAELEGQLTMVNDALTQISLQKQGLQSQLNAICAGYGQTNPTDTLNVIAAQITVIDGTLAELDTAEAPLQEGMAQIAAGKQQIADAKQQLAAGQTQLTAGQMALDTQSLLAAIEMSVAESRLYAGEMTMTQAEGQMDMAEEQMKEGEKQLKEAKKKLKEQLNLNNLLSTDLIKGILAGENFSMPAGYINEGLDEFLVRVGDKITTMESLEDLVLLDLGMDDLEPIRLGDVAEVTMQDDSATVYARLNGHPGVILTIEKQTGYSTGDVTDRLLKRIGEIEEEQTNVHFSVLMDQGVYIDLVVNSVLSNMLSGAALAILILLIFLKDLRPTFVIACSIPISVVTAFVLMYFSNISLNIISLSGLALGIGMLVDNSIVVIENIDRLRQLGMPARKAAVLGAKEVSGAIAASTLTTVCVFAPIVFTEGITRQLFVDMGLTIAYSLLASLVVALTLVPAMSAGLLRKTKPKKFRLLDAIRNVYGKVLAVALRVKFLVILLALALLIVSGYYSIQKGTAFMPEMESTQVTMTISVEKGTPFEDMAKVADDVIASIQDIEDIEGIGAVAGGGGMMSMMRSGSSGTATSVTAYILLHEDKKLSGKELEKEIMDRTKDFPCTVSVSTQSMDMSALGGSGIQVRIKGRELDRLSEICRDIAAIMENVEGTADVFDGQEDAEREFRVIVDKAKAMEYKLTVAQVFQKVQVRLAEANSATTLSTEDKDYSVYVYNEKDEAMTRKDLEKLTIDITNNEGETEKIKLSEIASFEEATGPHTITRDAQSRYMTVSAKIADGHNIGIVSSELEKKLADYKLPGGYSIEMTGEDETINDAMRQLFLMLALAVVFMYLIMVAQFQSLLSPFIVMFTIPLAFTGGFMGLYVADMEVSVIAMIGFIMLSGIIVNNGIVLVDYTNQLRAEGMEKREALVQAGRDRLRPIVMTALTTILGLSTMAAGMGMGGDMVQPMAVVTIGGLIYGTILTLFVVPCIYDFLNRKEYKQDDLDLEEAEDGEDNE